MGEGPTPTGMAGTAADPGADPEALRQIAFHYPDLRPVVAANPAAYQGLLDWLAALGDPRVDAALAQRGHGAGSTTAGGGTGAPVSYAPAAAAAQGTPVQGVPNGGGAQGPAGGTRRGTKIALVVLLVAALALIGVVWAIFRDASGGGESGASGESGTLPQSSASPDADASASPTPTESASGEVRYPAPAGAIAATSIVTPSGNIACTLEPDSVTCSIVEQSYAQNGLEDCGSQPFALAAGADSAARACGTSVPGTGAQLPYGSSAVNGNSVCLSDTNGMSCWNTISGQSFAMARQGWQTGNTGPIQPSNFLW